MTMVAMNRKPPETASLSRRYVASLKTACAATSDSTAMQSTNVSVTASTRRKNCGMQGSFSPQWCSPPTAIELIVQFLLIHPLIQAAFLSDEWAYLLTERIASGRTAEDRKLLPKILQHHNIDVTTVLLENGGELWETVASKVYPKRNKIVHAAEPTRAEEAQLAIDCATRLRADIVLPISDKLGLTLEVTGLWCRTKTQNGGAYFTRRDPFTNE